VNLPNPTRSDRTRSREDIYEEGWSPGHSKAVALYRDGCKAIAALRSSRKERKDDDARGQVKEKAAIPYTIFAAKPLRRARHELRHSGAAHRAGDQQQLALRLNTPERASRRAAVVSRRSAWAPQEGASVVTRSSWHRRIRDDAGEISSTCTREGAAFRVAPDTCLP